MAKIKVENHLYDKLKSVAETAGYASVDEFIVHTLEKEIEKFADTEDEEAIKNRLKGLGYIE